MVDKALFTSNKQDWGTPQWLYNYLDHIYHFTLDVCANEENKKCSNYFSEEDDGLRQDWGNNICFMNPPYNQTKLWVQKAYEESKKGATVVCLLASRTDTRWFHDYCIYGEVTFIKGRLKFEGGYTSAPFPSMIVVFNPKHSLRGVQTVTTLDPKEVV